jgi:hypothetical protein
MILLGVMEIYQLLIFSAVGVALYSNLVERRHDSAAQRDSADGVRGCGARVRSSDVFSGRLFRNRSCATAGVTPSRSAAAPLPARAAVQAPNLLIAVLVYTASPRLFHVDVGFGQMLAFLPVIFLAAALPLPFHAGALLLWTVLFPQYPEVGAFSLVMHTFFVSLNALIGVAFLPLANRELFVETSR